MILILLKGPNLVLLLLNPANNNGINYQPQLLQDFSSPKVGRPRLASVNVGKFAGCDCSRSMEGMGKSWENLRKKKHQISVGSGLKKDSQGLGRVDRRVAGKRRLNYPNILTAKLLGIFILPSLSCVFFGRTVHFTVTFESMVGA